MLNKKSLDFIFIVGVLISGVLAGFSNLRLIVVAVAVWFFLNPRKLPVIKYSPIIILLLVAIAAQLGDVQRAHDLAVLFFGAMTLAVVLESVGDDNA